MKHLVAWLPLLAIAVVTVPIYQQWQRSQPSRPHYDNPSTNWKKPALTKSPGEMLSGHWNVVPGSVEDGNTFQVQQQGRVEIIRLACVNAPQLDQPLGVRSRDHLRSLFAQANNHVILTIADTDRQGRKVAEVNVPTPRSDEEKFVQYEMVVAGWAYPYEKFADHCPNWDVVQQGMKEAKQNQRGVWAVAPAVKH
ncbi:MULTISPECIES: thermonuclease family protein [Trichocoleus]|uniref:Thermonuclease family protein n=1 Tax=Trichocoleus desertorum GB2-A4 TaxID=2933944 RepID=A0ABV0JF58_9CYAN|nr:thermonuclease family protein [Trichocoleus sp. FACHB-46]MBD1862331.1 thermonuclease family protein [Trichocoleus sp. FACHB-46]